MSTSDRSFYAGHSAFTDGGLFEPRLQDLPDDVAALAKVGQGLIVHEHLAPFYGVQLNDEARSSVHIRRVEQIVSRAVAQRDEPLDHERRMRRFRPSRFCTGPHPNRTRRHGETPEGRSLAQPSHVTRRESGANPAGALAGLQSVRGGCRPRV